MTSLFDRIRNIWSLSEYPAGQPTEETKEAGTEVAMIVKPPKKQPKDVFFPRNKRDPIKDIVNESPHE